MSEEGQEDLPCTECEGGYIQVAEDTRRPCPFCEGTNLRSRQLYTVLTQARDRMKEWRDRHDRAVRQREQLKKYLQGP